MSNQYAVAVASDARLLRRGCESLIGICNGLIADGELNDKEIVFLSTWLAENESIARIWPGEVVFCRVREVLADGVVTGSERAYLVATLKSLVGGSFADTGGIADGPNTLPINDDAVVETVSKSFCFTGQFIFGTRTVCERAIESRGGLVSATVAKKTNYLVIGDLASRAWKNTSHGTKIEHAVELQSQGVPIQIISEARWIRSLA